MTAWDRITKWLARVLPGVTPAPPPPTPAPTPAPPGPAPTPGPTPSIALALLDAHNAERRAARLAPLTLDVRLVAAAQAHSDWMAGTGELTHLGADGDPWARITRAGYRYFAASENIGFNERSVAEVVAAWMASPGHRDNILGPYTQMGGAVATGAKGPFWTCCFARPV